MPASRKNTKSPSNNTSKLGEIQPEVMYPLSDFQERSGLGKAAMREARQKGLKVRRVGRRHYVLGKDFIAYVEEHASVVGAGSSADGPG